MAQKCNICLCEAADGIKHCIYCGAEIGAREPKTVDELKAYCEARNLPTEKMRFFIGEDYREPKAFGIYEDADGAFVVYKNKADGTRAVRYSGPDEAYAVREIFIKMQQEIGNQKQKSARTKSEIRSYVDRSAGNGNSSTAKKKKSSVKRYGNVIKAIVIAVMAATFLFTGYTLIKNRNTPDSGYYYYSGDYYYNRGGSWYIFDDEEEIWSRSDRIDELTDNFRDYYAGYDFRDDYGIEDFRDSEFYQSYSGGYDGYDSGYDYDYDYDYDDDWDYDDWDSDYTDWDSDW